MKFPFDAYRVVMAEADDSGKDAGGGSVDRGDDYKSPLDDAGKDKDSMEEQEEEEEKPEGEEDSETPEEKAEREKAEAEEEKKKRIRIPKSRFDEAQAKARQREAALLEEIEKLKGGKQAAATQTAVKQMRTKIEELQDKYEDLILDGKKDEARKVRREVETMRDELMEYQTSVKSDSARKAAVDELTFNAKLAGYEAQYPTINPEHEDFDEDKTDEIAELLNAFVKQGKPRAEALAKAVKYVLGSPPAAANDDTKSDAAAKKAAQTEAARRKAAEADKRQPPSTNKAGLDSDKGGGKDGNIDVMKLSQKAFAKLEEETLAKLRGDIV